MRLRMTLLILSLATPGASQDAYDTQKPMAPKRVSEVLLSPRATLKLKAVLKTPNRILRADVIAPASDLDPVEVAKAFLGTALPGLVPEVEPSELRPKPMPYTCAVAPELGEKKSGATVVFERVILGRAVVGSSIKVRVSGEGRVLAVENALAPVRSGNVVAMAPSRFKTLPALVSGRNKRWQSMGLGTGPRRAAERAGTEVLLPMRRNSETVLVEARHVIWANARQEVRSGFLLGDGSLVGETRLSSPNADGNAIPLAHLDKTTGLPTWISYRRVGGKGVSLEGVFDNLEELAYRFLEENPTVFRTGAARCQFETRDVVISTAAPGTVFVKLGQIVAGVPVHGAELVFEIDSRRRIQTIQGHTIGRLDFDLHAQIAASDAEIVARSALVPVLATWPESHRGEVLSRRFPTRRVIFPGDLVPYQGPVKLQNRLAYLVESPLAAIFVDARSGSLLYGFGRRQLANIVRQCAGALIGVPCVEAARDGVRSQGLTLSPDAASAVPALTGTANFYSALGWSGLDGAGSDIAVNVDVNMGTCPNAFSPPVVEETFFCTGDVVPDVLAHEVTHGVIWNSSELIYADESGALNESYADVMGNLAFPDTLAGAWLVGEGSAAAAAGFVRNMAAPGLTTPAAQPATYSTYANRAALGCALLDPVGLLPGCDFGGVHTNSGIPNLAHVRLSDGMAGSAILPGIGRAPTRELAFDVLTRRLSSWSRFVDAALATRSACETFLATGANGVAFNQAQCDQVFPAFASVDVDPDLISDWYPPAVGFAGTIAAFPGLPTDNGCVATSLTLTMGTPGGNLMTTVGPLAAGAPAPTAALSYFGLLTATVATTAPPIGTATKAHAIAWTSAFGEQPRISSSIGAPPPAGAQNCRNPALVSDEARSNIGRSTGIPFVGGGGTATTGNATSAMAAACVLIATDIEILDDSGGRIGGPNRPTAAWSEVRWVAFVPITFGRTVTIATPPPGPPNLSATVTWTYTAGVSGVNWRLVYLLDKPLGTACNPVP